MTAAKNPKPKASAARKGRVFQRAAEPTTPSAGENEGAPAASARPDVQKPAASSAGKRTAFTWRLTNEQSLLLDRLQLRLRQDLDIGRIDRADLLDALARIADESPGVYGALLAKLQEVTE
ncbi:hypothetical protein [Actinomadura hibisca]|uniref:hypothetical protein n=1 Tax=Actinomadura hibisca TaxID=68565 RepID=UPI000A9F998D|nr:hypothetical protein [Actinomadura hibisca]